MQHHIKRTFLAAIISLLATSAMAVESAPAPLAPPPELPPLPSIPPMPSATPPAMTAPAAPKQSASSGFPELTLPDAVPTLPSAASVRETAINAHMPAMPSLGALPGDAPKTAAAPAVMSASALPPLPGDTAKVPGVPSSPSVSSLPPLPGDTAKAPAMPAMPMESALPPLPGDTTKTPSLPVAPAPLAPLPSAAIEPLPLPVPPKASAALPAAPSVAKEPVKKTAKKGGMKTEVAASEESAEADKSGLPVTPKKHHRKLHRKFAKKITGPTSGPAYESASMHFRYEHVADALYQKNYDGKNRHLPKAYYEQEYDALVFLTTSRDDFNALRTLLNTGRKVDMVNDQGDTPLLCAVRHNAINAARLLLARHANPNAVDRSGMSAMAIAQQNGHYPMMRALQAMSGSGPRASLAQ